MKKKYLIIIAILGVIISSLSAQNVGIGVASPLLKLDVNGDIYLQGDDLYMSYDGATNGNNDYMNYNDGNPTTLGSVGIFHFHADVSRAQAWNVPTASISADGAFFKGRVGIGTSSPQTIAHISGGATGDAILRLESDEAGTANEDDNPRLEMYQDGGNSGAMVGFYDGTNNAGNVFRIGTRISAVDDWNTFTINTVNRNVGIGIATPSEKLDIVGGGIQLNGNFGIGFNGATPYNANVTNDRAKIYYGNPLGSFYDFLIIEKTDANQNDPDGGIAFTMKGSDNVREAAFSVRGNSRIGVGSIISPAYVLELPNSNTAGVGRGRANAWVTYSDGRIKNERKTIKYGLKTVLKMNPLSYQHHDSKHDKEGNIEILEKSQQDIGFIAQDMQKLIPEIVHQPKDAQKDLWSIDYIRLVPVLTKAIQEQQTKIEQLEKRRTVLIEEINKLSN